MNSRSWSRRWSWVEVEKVEDEVNVDIAEEEIDVEEVEVEEVEYEVKAEIEDEVEIVK